MSWVEYINSPQMERNDDGFIHATRNFKVWNYSRASILANPKNVRNDDNVPLLEADLLRDNYIEIPDPYGTADVLLLIAYDMRLTPHSLVSEVEVRYSNDIRLLSKPFGQDSLGRAPKGKAGAFQSTYEPIPIMLKTALVINPVNGLATFSGWEERQWQVPTQKNRLSYSMLINTSKLLTYRQTISQYLGKVLRFGAAFVATASDDYLLFEGFDYSHHSPGLTSATLFFEQDIGLLKVPANSPIRMFPPRDKTFVGNPGVLYVRPPYQQLQMVRDAQGNPVWQTLEWHPFEVNGGANLLLEPERP